MPVRNRNMLEEDSTAEVPEPPPNIRNRLSAVPGRSGRNEFRQPVDTPSLTSTPVVPKKTGPSTSKTQTRPLSSETQSQSNSRSGLTQKTHVDPTVSHANKDDVRQSSSRRKQKVPKQHKKIDREIRVLQGTTSLLIPKLSFQRLVRELTARYTPHPDFKYTSVALACLQEAAELKMVNWFEMIQFAVAHRDRITIMPKDSRVIMAIIEAGGYAEPCLKVIRDRTQLP